MLIDSHAHLTNPLLLEDLDSLLEGATMAGIDKIVNICTDPDEARAGFALSQKYPWVYNVAATTPHDAAKEGEFYFEEMATFARAGSLVAIGETGLDYHHYADSKKVQKEFLCRYLHLAQECQLPVVIHCREAFSDFFEIIDAEYKNCPGVLHCFTGTLEEAEGILTRNWYLSLSGIVTFKKSHILQQVAQMVPLDQLLIETDAPFLAPTPHRGERNEPAFLIDTARFIAELRDISLEELAAATSANACRLFGI